MAARPVLRNLKFKGDRNEGGNDSVSSAKRFRSETGSSNDANFRIVSMEEATEATQSTDSSGSHRAGVLTNGNSGIKNSNPGPTSVEEEFISEVFSGTSQDIVKIREKMVGYGRESGNPIPIKLTHYNSLNSSREVQRKGAKLLDRMTEIVTSLIHLGEEIPQIKLNIEAEFFRDENHQSFSNFLALCASGLVELMMEIPENGGSMTFLFPTANVTFPNLTRLTVAFPCKRLSFEGDEARFSSGTNDIALPFLQSILSGTQKLEAMSFAVAGGMESLIPLGLKYLRLPPTVISLKVPSFVRSSELEMLLNFDLPNLKELKFCVSTGPYTNGLVSRILAKFSPELRHLHILYGTPPADSTSVANYPTFFQIPRMENLEILVHWVNIAQLEAIHPPLHVVMPNLNTLCLLETINNIRKWIGYSIFPKVDSLYLGVQRGFGQLPTLNLNTHFPNVNNLSLRISNKVKTGDLSQIFMGMQQLKSLELRIPAEWCDETNGDWDSILTALPSGLLLELRKTPEIMQNLKWTNRSIANLQELESIVLESPPIATRKSLISDAVFHLAFLQMPKLKTLELIGGFKASNGMVNVWRDDGRVLLQN